MSDERLKKLEAAAPAMPNQPSIMSAPREPKKVKYTLIIIGALIVSVVVNVILVMILLTKNQRMYQLETEITDNKELIDELKNKLQKATETP